MDPLLDFTGKVAVITGAAQGFGKLLAEELAKRGAKLVISDINEAGVHSVADEIAATGAHVIALKCNVAKNEDCKAMVDAAIEHFGRVDIGVNNAGIAHEFHALHEIDEALMDKQFAVNVKGVQFGMSHQIQQMLKQQGGAILNVSSMAGLGGAAKVGAYSMAKHAVIGLTKTGAVEYGRHNIRINAICPFFTLTQMVTDMADENMQSKMSLGAPMKRLAEPKEVVAVMLMMLSPANTYMTGQCIAIDGGVSAQ
ncbi:MULTISPECIES: SDR family NAD(P)-dependent oxidoreductase [unclassified Colwellia]|jgi:NAD(P)-dependent dehydrogenase (short-subunit alcohol dehydrogenase family)|uniref:SDR family NAD(P)-dependent oxidoreductase n=1 Tax=unclassified Colwellia TaxID=196834 RepID=UPI0015F35981|nr:MULTISPECIES: SDR family oxidoreductase [unclassified Colwellia]MBA6233837.1 SDR family oxidoreductase [Colwellia sp. MB02u-7]MBA6237347.1 SDR family oxidoreductase [Colwellia sp. MB02u-11]MBA6256477.1 SDR family oxidoreductase [Colwellia sp. MB3u-28]MBA6260320.1 SDR family oxidoreductase [Colwellia sp. MB3u-41]MBA6300347.1 SDR family oxidoreductase [Colwellia sp. MB3u-22]